MTRHEATVISAYTGYFFCRAEDLYEYFARKTGRSVRNRYLTKELFESVHDAALEDLLQMDFQGAEGGDDQ